MKRKKKTIVIIESERPNAKKGKRQLYNLMHNILHTLNK